MIVAYEYDTKIDRRTDWRRRITWQQPAGTPVNLTGFVARAQVRRSEAADPVVTLDGPGGGLTLGGAAGTIDLYLSAAATAAIPTGTYLWDVLIGPAGGDLRKLVKGSVLVLGTVTHGVTGL